MKNKFDKFSEKINEVCKEFGMGLQEVVLFNWILVEIEFEYTDVTNEIYDFVYNDLEETSIENMEHEFDRIMEDVKEEFNL